MLWLFEYINWGLILCNKIKCKYVNFTDISKNATKNLK